MRERDSLEVEALVADRYLESLLAARDRHAADAPVDATLDPDLRSTARLLEATLGRVHPSFRFEERLANDLAAKATGARGREGRFGRPSLRRRPDGRALVPFRSRKELPAVGAAASGRTVEPGDGVRPPVSAGRSVPPRLDPGGARRPLIIGGALTSAALSIAGAYVAWRRGRPPINPMVRAVRAAHRTGITRRVARRSSRLALPRTGPAAG